jgi:uncharacterized protein YlaI
MPIVRTFCCPDCFHQMDVTLSMDQVDDPPPYCPECDGRYRKLGRPQMNQEFKPVALGGSNLSKAASIAERIATEDYNVSDFKLDGQGGKNKVRYRDSDPSGKSTWGIASEALQGAIQAGRQTRLQHGSGLDVLQANLKSGAQPDLIELSKERMRRDKMILG